MIVDSAARPLGAMLRVLLAAVVLTAFAVDQLLAIGVGSLTPSRIGAMLFVGGVAVAGIGWTLQPRHGAATALTAATASLLATRAAPGDYLPFALFTDLVVLPVLFGAVLAGRRWWRWPLAGYVAFAAEATALRGADPLVRWVVALAMLVLLAAAVTAVVYIRLRDRERAMSIERARHVERLDLARELHDIVGHHVTGIVVLAQAQRFTAAQSSAGDRQVGDVHDPGHGKLRKAPADAHDETLREIERAGLETLTSIRRLVGMLRADPATTTAGPQLADIDRIVENLRRTHPMAELHVDAGLRASWVPGELATTVQRLVQEIATNVRRHGDPAHPSTVTLGRRLDELTLIASNTPAGGPRTTGGYGLVGMRERVESLGGSFAAGLDGAGMWMVTCRLPLIAVVPA